MHSFRNNDVRLNMIHNKYNNLSYRSQFEPLLYLYTHSTLNHTTAWIPDQISPVDFTRWPAVPTTADHHVPAKPHRPQPKYQRPKPRSPPSSGTTGRWIWAVQPGDVHDIYDHHRHHSAAEFLTSYSELSTPLKFYTCAKPHFKLLRRLQELTKKIVTTLLELHFERCTSTGDVAHVRKCRVSPPRETLMWPYLPITSIQTTLAPNIKVWDDRWRGEWPFELQVRQYQQVSTRVATPKG